MKIVQSAEKYNNKFCVVSFLWKLPVNAAVTQRMQISVTAELLFSCNFSSRFFDECDIMQHSYKNRETKNCRDKCGNQLMCNTVAHCNGGNKNDVCITTTCRLLS